MLRIKKLYIFMLSTFLPQFLMTFFICLFIVMMQFLWGHLSDLVGKGLGIGVLSELIFYAALSFVPLALPLAILLASLMTFGNLGEHVELTAMKSSGISLLKVMSPLVVFLSFVAVGAFFFQNNVIPQAQVKMWTLLFSMRQKSPTLDIPEGTVYTQIPGYNLYVKHKQPDGDMLYNLLIYDVTNGVGYPRIVAADSGRLAITPDKRNLILSLYHGNWYE
ncbi:MAG: LptF/LptG family permease, partial [Muribaculaceae bacterium]|nr:LptF/LptG family permease [Muribaculaceae bacterium]